MSCGLGLGLGLPPIFGKSFRSHDCDIADLFSGRVRQKRFAII